MNQEQQQKLLDRIKEIQDTAKKRIEDAECRDFEGRSFRLHIYTAMTILEDSLEAAYAEVVKIVMEREDVPST